MSEILLLLDSYEEISSFFFNNDKLGIVIPDIPFYFKHLHEHSPFSGGSGKNRENCQLLWTMLKNVKYIDFSSLTTPIMPYGNMFWYKPVALKPLFDLNLSKKDFLKEPMLDDGTIAHAIERLPVYIAWSQGYDYRVVLNNENVESGFNYKASNRLLEQKDRLLEQKDRLLKQKDFKINSVRRSYTWRIGRLFTWLPERIIQIIRSFIRGD
jgi:rhamnosyltransferase